MQLYFRFIFNKRPKSDSALTMLTRRHECGYCLTYDYAIDDVMDLLGEKHLDMISALSKLISSQPLYFLDF